MYSWIMKYNTSESDARSSSLVGKSRLILLLPLWFLLLSPYIQSSSALPEIIRLGGLFDNSDQFEETAFRHAIERVNEDPNVLPRSRLSAQWEKLPSGDSFHASKKVCKLLNEGVAVIIGPQSPPSASHVQSVCDSVEVPHIETAWDFRSIRGNYIINLFPHPAVLTTAYSDLITAWGWDKYIIIYQDNESLVRLQGILKESNPASRQAFVRQLPPDDDYRPLFKSLRLQVDISNLILDCDTSKLSKIFEDARATGMMRDKKYFLTSLDVHTLNRAEFTSMDINITSFRLVDPNSPKVQHVVDQWKNLVLYGFPNRTYTQNYFVDVDTSLRNRGRQTTTPSADPIPSLPNNMLTTETALIYDSVELIAKALHALDTSQPQRIDLKSLNCKKQNTWQHGFVVLEALRKTLFEGLTGIVEIDPATGFRREVQLDVMELTQKGLSKIGLWDSKRQGDRLSWTRTAQETLKQQEEDLKDKTFIVTTKLSPPYCVEDPPDSNNYTGYAVDLIDELSQALGFKYEIRKVSDNKYGVPDNRTGQWNGMIGEILSGGADIAIADLTINYDRERAVDFTMPFMNLGISILYQKPPKKPPSLFSFLEPFSPDVWIYMATAFLGVSLVLFVLARFSPYDWLEPAPCSSSFGEILENQFNLVNSLWFSVGSLMQQGCDILPKAMSTRTVASMWWFFTLIMISSYTANLAAFLTSEGLEEGITDVKSLPGQTKVKYGCVQSGTTAAFFRDSSFPVYKEIWSNMVNMKPSPFVDGSSEGISRVKQSAGTYAYFMESVSIEYITQRDCTLTQLGGLLDSKGYGIGLRKNSKYRDAFNTKILEFAEQGVLEKLKHRWWVEMGGGKCPAAVATAGGATPLTLGNVGGVFVVLLGGCAAACIMAMLEFLWKSRKLARNEGESFWTEIGKELRFALQCQGEKKPVKKSKPPTENPSLAGSVPYLAFARREPSD